jgi:hypothetical protein
MPNPTTDTRPRFLGGPDLLPDFSAGQARSTPVPSDYEKRVTSGIAAREFTEAAPHAQPGTKFNNHSTRVRNDFGVQPGRRRRINRRTTDERHDASLLLPGG